MQSAPIAMHLTTFDPRAWIVSLAYVYTIYESETEYRFECVHCQHSAVIEKGAFDFGQAIQLAAHTFSHGKKSL